MPRHRGCLARRSVHVHRVVGAFPQQLAAMGFDMRNEVTPLQAGVILKRSRITERVPRASWARVRLASRTRRTASSRRSEEHTSELQSRFDLVCRLLLE